VSTDGVELPNACVCDTTRPLSVSDCAADEAFVCRKATSSAGQQLEEPVLFDCKCLAALPNCMTCDAAYMGDRYWHCEDICAAGGRREILCGCAVIVLAH
jgi:hypothetical protein